MLFCTTPHGLFHKHVILNPINVSDSEAAILNMKSKQLHLQRMGKEWPQNKHREHETAHLGHIFGKVSPNTLASSEIEGAFRGTNFKRGYGRRTEDLVLTSCNRVSIFTRYRRNKSEHTKPLKE
ncbi:hypothetical protein BV25DRAFT_1819675 [Artomyces pyxidatus]|uniref:Uncharacterized protein n=1 Tax=Artomyces pyxidatus TaxID=48021 RepID=A0ACB8TFX1_9AGAM|nr:hypothetical protein BV25DRAFT_1819675 [Artomyces pyxidatus]